MEQEEMAQRLADRFGVSLDRARAALILAGGDLLDAARLLEGEDPAQAKRVGAYSTAVPDDPPAPATGEEGWSWQRVWTLIRGIFLHPTANRLEVTYPGGGRLNVPVLVVCLGILVAFWIATAALGIGWVLGCRYVLRGPEVDIPQVNRGLEEIYELMAKWRKHLGL